ncbi:MAG TPA: phage tail protein, partial [Allosphingosinicella sp.]
MATLVLSTVGFVVGGPIGGAVGAAIGQQIDSRIFAPKARQGPRIGDLAVQTSNYGSQIPKIFGMMRIAGTVIWATDLREEKEKSGGGKGRPKTVTYSYSGSFAVALSARRVREVRRIWADGKLLRGAAGDFKSEVGAFRLHTGDEDQAADPLILAAEGASNAPGYRGTAYAVFEDLQLADFGNRIPSLTFEVVGEDEASLAAIAEALSDGDVTADEAAALMGYSATGDSARSAIEALGDLLPLRVRDLGERLCLGGSGGDAPVLAGQADAFAEGGGGGRMEMERGAANSLPAAISVAFYDPTRDYQSGLQRATTGETGLRAERRMLPAVVPAPIAKALAEQCLAESRAGTRTIKAHYGWDKAALRPGLPVRVAGQPGRWRVARWSLEKMVLTLGLVGTAPVGPAASAATPGRPVGEPDVAHGPTSLFLLDLPLTPDGQPTSHAQLLVAAAGREPGWRSAPLIASFDDGAHWEPAGGTAGAAVAGTLLAPVPARGSALLDLETV